MAHVSWWTVCLIASASCRTRFSWAIFGQGGSAPRRRPVPLMRTPSHDADESWARAGCEKSDLGR